MQHAVKRALIGVGIVVLVVLLAAGGLVGAVFAWPGAAIRQLQQWQIDGALGAPATVDGPDGAIRVWERGDPFRPRVVFVHGFGDAAAGWVPVVQSLEDTHSVLVLDLPGHGRSDPRGAVLTMDQLQAGLRAVLDREDAPFVLVGNSLGGWLAADYTLEHPERVRHLMLVNAAGLSRTIPKETLLPTTREGVVAKNRIILGEHAPELPGVFLDGMVQLHAEPRMHALFDELARGQDHLDDRVGDIAVPMTLLWGTPDDFFPVDGYLDRWQAAVPGAATVLLDGCGHAPQYSCPEDVARQVRAATE